MKCGNVLCPADLPESPVIIAHNGKVHKFCCHICALNLILLALKDLEWMIEEMIKHK